MSAVSERLKAARDLYAANPTHVAVFDCRPRGSNCAMSAIFNCGANDLVAYDAERALQTAIGGDVVDFNTSHTTAEVIAAYDRAIEAAS